MKKFLSLVLALVMVLSMASFASAEEELVTLKVLAKNDYSSEIKTEDWLNYKSSKIFNERIAQFGLKLEFECIDNGSFNDVVTTRMAAQVDMPDIISCAFGGPGQSNIVKWGQNGLVIAASDLIEQYDTDNSILTFWEEKCPGTLGTQIAADGKLYWFCYLYAPVTYDINTGAKSSDISGYRTLLLRADWLEKVGVEYKPFWSPDELIDVLVKFQENDVNGSGVKDEVINVSIDGFWNGLAQAFGLGHNTLYDCYTIGEKADNTIFSPWQNQEGMTKYLEFMSKCVEKGLIDTQIMGQDTTWTTDLLVENKAALCYNYATWGDYETQIPVDGVLYLPIILDEDGDPTTGWIGTGDMNGALYNESFVTSACKDPEKALALYDYMYSMEFAFLSNYVEEGVDYTVDEKGIVTPTNWLEKGIDTSTFTDEEKWAWRWEHTGFAGTSAGLYGLLHFAIIPSYGYVESVSPNVTDPIARAKQEAVLEIRKYEQYCNYLQDGVRLGQHTDEEVELLNDIGGTLSTFASEAVGDIVLGRRPITDLASICEELENIGLSDYIAARQAARTRGFGK